MKKPLNNKGSILQIVLIIFLIILSVIIFSTSLMISKMNSYRDIDTLMKEKNIEIMLVRFYLDTIENDILISDSMILDNNAISYTVDDMGNYYLITTTIDIEVTQYQFIVQIEKENVSVKKIEYREEF